MKNLTNIQKSLLKAFIFWAILLCIGLATAQSQTTYKIVGNEIVKVEDQKAKPTKTGLTHTIKGIKYPVYKSVKGSYFIIRTSKKTGKEYKQYLKIKK